MESPTLKPPHSLPSVIARTFAVFCVIAPMSLLFAAVCVLLLPWRGLRIRTGNLYGWLIAMPMLRMAGLGLDIRNLERIRDHAPALYVANHTSTLDMWMGMWVRPSMPMQAKVYCK